MLQAFWLHGGRLQSRMHFLWRCVYRKLWIIIVFPRHRISKVSFPCPTPKRPSSLMILTKKCVLLFSTAVPFWMFSNFTFFLLLVVFAKIGSMLSFMLHASIWVREREWQQQKKIKTRQSLVRKTKFSAYFWSKKSATNVVPLYTWELEEQSRAALVELRSLSRPDIWRRRCS